MSEFIGFDDPEYEAAYAAHYLRAQEEAYNERACQGCSMVLGGGVVECIGVCEGIRSEADMEARQLWWSLRTLVTAENPPKLMWRAVDMPYTNHRGSHRTEASGALPDVYGFPPGDTGRGRRIAQSIVDVRGGRVEMSVVWDSGWVEPGGRVSELTGLGTIEAMTENTPQPETEPAETTEVPVETPAKEESTVEVTDPDA